MPAYSDKQQNQVGTLIHEISHAVLNTQDEEVAVPVMPGLFDNNPSFTVDFTAYDKLCKRLANENPARAANNAENWGFYCSQFYYKHV